MLSWTNVVIAGVALTIGTQILDLAWTEAVWLAAAAVIASISFGILITIVTRRLLRKGTAEIQAKGRKWYESMIADLEDAERCLAEPIRKGDFFTVNNEFGASAKDILWSIVDGDSCIEVQINSSKHLGCYSEYVGSDVPAIINEAQMASSFAELVPAVGVARNFLMQAQRAQLAVFANSNELLEKPLLITKLLNWLSFDEDKVERNNRELVLVESRANDAANRILKTVHQRCEAIFEAGDRAWIN